MSEWRTQAACLDSDPSVFFPPQHGSAAAARQICSGCGVRDECLQWALDTGQKFGIYGGLIPRERRTIRMGRVPDGFKRCSKCATVRPQDEFHANALTSDGLSSWCKPCRKKTSSLPPGRVPMHRTGGLIPATAVRDSTVSDGTFTPTVGGVRVRCQCGRIGVANRSVVADTVLAECVFCKVSA